MGQGNLYSTHNVQNLNELSSDDVNQFLTTPAANLQSVQLYAAQESFGTRWNELSQDLSQCEYVDLTFSPTANITISAVAVPMNILGGGSDITLTLYEDNGSGGWVTPALNSITIPREWILTMSPVDGLTDTSPPAASPLMNTLLQGLWSTPVDGGYVLPAQISGVPGVVLTQWQQWMFAVGNSSEVFAAPFADPGLGLWVSSPPMPFAFRWQGICVMGDGTIIVSGGQDSTGVVYVHTYAASFNADGTFGAWTELEKLPTSLYSHGMVATPDNFVLLIGGQQQQGTPPTDVPFSTCYYSRWTGTALSPWNNITSLPMALGTVSAAYVNGWILARGQDVNGNWHAYAAEYQGGGQISAWYPIPVGPFQGYSPWGVVDDVYAVNASYAASITAADVVAGIWLSPSSQIVNNAVGPAVFESDDGTYYGYAVGSTGYSFHATPAAVVLFHFYALSLTAGTKYHAVLSLTNTPVGGSLTLPLCDDPAGVAVAQTTGGPVSLSGGPYLALIRNAPPNLAYPTWVRETDQQLLVLSSYVRRIPYAIAQELSNERFVMSIKFRSTFDMIEEIVDSTVS